MKVISDHGLLFVHPSSAAVSDISAYTLIDTLAKQEKLRDFVIANNDILMNEIKLEIKAEKLKREINKHTLKKLARAKKVVREEQFHISCEQIQIWIKEEKEEDFEVLEGFEFSDEEKKNWLSRKDFESKLKATVRKLGTGFSIYKDILKYTEPLTDEEYYGRVL